nr:MAG TPA: putative mRNA interferase [Caudoviricetes sp.]
MRCCGSHQVWSNGANKITLPTVKLSPVIAARLIKENKLKTQ